MRYLRVALSVAGVILLGVLVAENDPATILASIRGLSWRLPLLLVFPATLVAFLDAVGWRYAFARDRVGLGSLFWTRAAGEAFNMITPTAAMGGEAIKVWMLRGRAPVDESLASVIVAKTTITVGQGLLLLLGVVVAWHLPNPDSRLLVAMQWLLVLEILALAAFVALQTRGILGWGGRMLERVGLLARRGAVLGRADNALGRFYRDHRGRFVVSVGCHFAAWLLGAVETYLILLFLGTPVSPLTAVVIEAFGTGIRFATFFIPAGLGTYEGGNAAIFVALGLSSTLGVAFSLVRRIREATWVALGLLAFALMRSRDGAAMAPCRNGAAVAPPPP
jgi:glycosyltransferase 2 family protein